MDFQNKFLRIRNFAILFCGITIGLYIINFFDGKIKLSPDPDDWGVFGDYFGGLLNPVISFLNLLLTYYIALMVNDFSKRENVKQLLVQNRVIKSQLKYDALRDFQREINLQFEKFYDQKMNNSMVKINIEQAMKIVQGFHQAYNHLFTENPMFQTRLVNDLQTAITKMEQQEKLRENYGSQFTGQSNSHILNPLIDSKDSMLSNLNKEIVNVLDKNLIMD